jgi:uncharacterized protein YcfJ
MGREIVGSVLGAIVGGTIARALGHEDAIATAAIAGAFVGPGLLAVASRALAPRDTPRE